MKWFLVLLAAAVAGGLFYLKSLGLFLDVPVSEKETGPYMVAYLEHKGDYSQIGNVQMSVYKGLKEIGVDAQQGFGLYYDDPKMVAKEELRSIGGCILESDYYSKLDQIRNNYKITELPRAASVVAEFPYENVISIFLGVKKVYPALSKYMNEKGYKPVPSLEIYDIKNKKIIYAMKIEYK